MGDAMTDGYVKSPRPFSALCFFHRRCGVHQITPHSEGPGAQPVSPACGATGKKGDSSPISPERIRALSLSSVPLQGVLFLLLVLSFLAACGSEKPSSSPAPAVAKVNGESISLNEFEKALAGETALAKRDAPLKAEETESLRAEVLDNLIHERIMIQRARDLSLAVGEAELAARIEEIRKDYNGDQFDKLFGDGGISLPEWKGALQKRVLLEKLIARDVNAKIQVTDDEAQRYYNANRKAYATERRVHVAQIVVPDRDRAVGILKRLKAGEDFGKVAREVSIGPETARGGDLGFFERGVMPEAIDRMVFSLPEGKVSRVAQSPYGFHLFKVLGQAAAGGRKFADVKEKVIADLRKQKEAEAYKIWIEGLKAKASIQINRPLPGGPASAEAETKDVRPSAVPEKR
jgi:parvulin-like peptidyl-prolyl isomerase